MIDQDHDDFGNDLDDGVDENGDETAADARDGEAEIHLLGGFDVKLVELVCVAGIVHLYDLESLD